ncbi:Cytochrome P450 [Plasmopara halstedii]|uniref:Cytochrome P450 n=1 Tax=Plasmopara halstedii TaxID=4781 RepID=A0A0P1APN4_PLAHL|nr:Cytochrome P450 [Plasmopara halstedii]CEG43175.1 Cytochrome P450 [Plasmopara halstedii]|eukprot:XP_024579544.1 Cytochrome P450 [Plasmopara halstedii]
MWSITSHESTYHMVLLTLGTISTIYVSYKVLSLPVPVPDPEIEQLYQPPSTLPVLGNTLDLLFFHRSRLSDWINEQTNASNGKPWQLKLLFQRPWIVLSMPQDLHDVFVDKFHVFEKGGTLGEMSFDVLGHGLLNVNGEQWAQQRRAVTSLFSSRNLRKMMIPVLYEKIRQVENVLTSAALNQDIVNLKSLLNQFTAHVFTRIGFGIDFKEFQDEEEIHPLDIALNAVQYRFQTPMWMWKLSRWLNIGTEKRLRESMKQVQMMVRKILLQTMNKQTLSEATNLLTLLLQETESITPQELQDTAVNFFIAGKDTTSFSLSWLIVMFNRYPYVVNKVRQEIQEKSRDFYSGKHEFPTFEEIQEFVYLDAAVKESVRLWSVSTYRYATRDTTLESGTFIPKGTIIVVSKYAAARRQSVWGQDAAVYRPERWFDESGARKEIVPPEFITFSTGPRKCMGMRLAMIEMKLVLAVLFTRFDIETVEDPWNITYDLSFMLPVKGPLAVRVRKR